MSSPPRSSPFEPVPPARSTSPSHRTRLLTILVEFATVGQTEDGKIYHRLWSADEITELLKKHDLAKKENTEDK